MNEEVILNMVNPYLHENSITYNEFENIFSVLSRKEQYGVVNILYEHNILLRDEEEKRITPDTVVDDLDYGDEEFKILYDEELFKDSNRSSQKDDVQVLHNNVRLSNEILCKLIQEGNKQAEQDICIKNKKLVEKYANDYKNYYGNHLEFEDIEQAGMIGLIEAAKKFNTNRGVAFSTYAVFWIRQKILREIMDNGFVIRVPVHVIEDIKKVTRIDNQCDSKDIDFNERMQVISDKLGYTVEYVKKILTIRKNYLSYSSLNVPIGEEVETEVQDMISDDKDISIEDIVAFDILHEMIVEVLSTLNEREEKVLKLRFGLVDERAHTLEEIGRMFNVTRERIRQIELKALEKLRRPSILSKLKDFL